MMPSPVLPLTLFFLDYRLGQETGLEFLKRIRDAGDTRPVICLTGHTRYGKTDFDLGRRMGNLGACAYLTKPFSFETLLEAVPNHSQRDGSAHLNVEVASQTPDSAPATV